MKHALVTPLLKGHSLDPECLRSYRPVSNLSFTSKLTERVVAQRLTDHVSEHQLRECYQSAYHSYHSAETALVVVQNDILEAFDNRQGVILVLLDPSAAFDTFEHSMLVSHLQRRFGITGTASVWIESYLSGWSQSVVLSGNTSHSSNLPYGVPQESVLSPLLFTFYTCPVGDSIRNPCTFSCTQMILRSTSVSSLLTGKTKRLLYIRWNIIWSRFVTGWRGMI